MTESTQLRPLVGYEEAQAEGAAYARKHFPRLDGMAVVRAAASHAARRASRKDGQAAKTATSQRTHRPTYEVAFLTGWIEEFSRLEAERATERTATHGG